MQIGPTLVLVTLVAGCDGNLNRPLDARQSVPESGAAHGTPETGPLGDLGGRQDASDRLNVGKDKHVLVDVSGGFTQQIRLTIDHTKVIAGLADFPLLVHLGTASGINNADLSAIFANLGTDANRKKISVKTSSGAQCYVEIENWDTSSKQAWLWVRVPTVSSSTDTVLYLYYDKNQADNTSYVGDIGSTPAKNVWDSGFKLVLHLADQGTTALDSTANANHGTKSGGVTTVAGQIGPSAQFDGSSGYINIADNDGFSLTTTGHLLISTWFSPAVLVMDDGSRDDGQIRFFSKSGSNNHEWALNYYNKGSERDMGIAYYLCNLPGGLCCGHYADLYGSSANYLNPGEWEQLIGRGDVASAVIDGVAHSHWVSVYKNGAFKHGQSYDGTTGAGCSSSSGMLVNPANGTAPVVLGHSPYTGCWLNGRLDEVRIDSVARTDAWIAADYHSQHDSLIRFQFGQ